MTSENFEKILKSMDRLKDAEMIVVPLKPRDFMIDLGASAGGVDLETAKMIYEVMVQSYFLNPFDE